MSFQWRVARPSQDKPRQRLTAQALAEALAATLDNEWLRSRAAEVRDQGRARRASEPDPVDRFL